MDIFDNCVFTDIKEEVIETQEVKEDSIAEDDDDEQEEEVKKNIFNNLATLAEVSLATAAQDDLTVDKGLKRQIDRARAKINKGNSNLPAVKKAARFLGGITTIVPVTPMPGKRTMQVSSYV